MRVQSYMMNTGLGYTVPANALVPAPPRPKFRGMNGFGGEWEDWCDQNYWTPENNTKCKVCSYLPFGPCTYFKPWTTGGKSQRGLPSQTDLQRLGPPPDESAPPPDSEPLPDAGAPPSESWFEKNKMLVIAGGGVVALGLIALAMRGKKGKGLFGMGSVHRRKRRKSRSRR